MYKLNLRQKVLLRALPFVSVLLLTISCKSSELPGTWMATAIEVDGNISDWEGVGAALLENESAAVRIANDLDHLYLLLQLRDAQMARMVRLSGIKIWLNNKGNKDESFLLKYTGGPSPEQMVSAGMIDTLWRGGPPGMEQASREQPGSSDELICYIKDRLEEKSIPLDGAQGPAAGCGIQDGTIYYEFSIPLTETEVQNYGLGSAAGSEIGLGLIWGDIDRDAMRERGGGRGGIGGPPGGGGRGGPPGGGGGMGGPGGGGPRGGRGFERPEKQEVWLKTSLATEATE